MMSFVLPFWDDPREWRFGIAQEVYSRLLPDSAKRYSDGPLPIYKTVSNREVESFGDGTLVMGEW